MISKNSTDVFDTTYFKPEQDINHITKFGVFAHKLKVNQDRDGHKIMSEEHILHRRDHMFIPTSLPLASIENIQCKDYSFIETIDVDFVKRYYLIPKISDLPVIRIEEESTTIFYNPKE